MKKGKLLALALVAGITFMGAGYAAWTDEINVNTVVSTGKLEVKIDGNNKGSYTDIFLDKKSNGIIDGNVSDTGWERVVSNNNPYGIVITDPEIENNEIKFQFEGLFPGVRASSYFKVINTGTVPAKIQNVEVKCKVKNLNEETYVPVNKLDSNDPKLILYNNLEVRYKIIIRKDKDIIKVIETPLVALSGLQDMLNQHLIGQTLRSGEFLETGDNGAKELHIDVSENLKGDQGENQSVQIAIKFNFIQSNLDQ